MHSVVNDEEQWWTRSCNGCENNFFLKKKFTKHQEQYHALNINKWVLRER